ncbi:MAG: FHA domain-containing protein [Tannerellaceae bacterium]|jgi:hypothetical protein|nr:FHA domain-containing protein [Tannerellaceae bacterium]
MNIMRCSHCGWDNKERRLKCKKCNSLLQSVVPPAGRGEQSWEDFSQPAMDLLEDMFEKVCIECNYPLLPDAISCPFCGAQLRVSEGSEPPPLPIWTEINGAQPSCRIRRLGAYDGRKLQIISLVGSRIVLNRDSIDPVDISLSEQAHALLECENGKWFIQDRSEDCTTFVRAAARTELKAGDIIALGNQRFEFG